MRKTTQFQKTTKAFTIKCQFQKKITKSILCRIGFPNGSDSKASAHNTGDLGSIPGSGKSPGEGMAPHSSTLAWKIPWIEDTGRLQSMGSQSRTQLRDFLLFSDTFFHFTLCKIQRV